MSSRSVDKIVDMNRDGKIGVTQVVLSGFALVIICRPLAVKLSQGSKNQLMWRERSDIKIRTGSFQTFPDP